MLGRVEIVAAFPDRALAVDTDDVGHARFHQDLGAGHPRRPDARDDDVEVGHLLVDDLQRVLQRRQHNHRGAVLIVVEHRDVEQFLQPFLDLEALRRGDVFEVDAAEHRRDPLHALDDLVGARTVEADREAVDAGELLEEKRLAFHDGEGALGTDVAQTEHGGAVGDDGHGVLLDRQVVHPLGLGLDRLAHASHPGGVRHREIVAIADREQRQHLDLAALVHGERAVLPLEDLDTVETPHRVEHLLLMGLARAVDDDVFIEGRVLGLEALHRPDVAAYLADRHGQSAEHPRFVGEAGANANGVGSSGGTGHPIDGSGARRRFPNQ